MNIVSSNDQSNEVVKGIVEHVMPHFEIKGEMIQFKSSISPWIANAMYHRDKNIREQERLTTLITLARVLPNEYLHSAIDSLGYRIVLIKEDL